MKADFKYACKHEMRFYLIFAIFRINKIRKNQE